MKKTNGPILPAMLEDLEQTNRQLLETLQTIAASTPRTNKKGMIWLSDLTALQAMARSAIKKAKGE